MCGINGFYSRSLSPFDNVVEKMNLAISHRGPDSNGTWSDKDSGIVLGHQRLSIIDLSLAGHQPMRSSSGRFILTYNGEVYNHLEIRKEIENKNSYIKWRGNSDTEILIEAIDLWGVEIALQKIDGMFAFAVWDRKTRSLTLARDRIGEKPLYFGWQGKRDNKVFLFGSGEREIKQLVIWENAYQNTYIASKELSLSEELTLMAYLDLMISMDSANGHIAANCGIPVLTIWGLTHPFCGFKPFDQPIENSLTLDRKKYPEIPTSIFGDRIPNNYEFAFRSLDPKTVIEKVLEILDSSRYHHS